jgi:hypothetical protein
MRNFMLQNFVTALITTSFVNIIGVAKTWNVLTIFGLPTAYNLPIYKILYNEVHESSRI